MADTAGDSAGRRALLAVLLLDAGSVTGFVLRAARRRRAEDVELAVAAVASLLPGVAAVALELRRDVRAAAVGTLFAGGSAIGTAGTLRTARRHGWSGAGVVLLVGANVVAVPYLAVVRARRRRNGLDFPGFAAMVGPVRGIVGRARLGVTPRVASTCAPTTSPPDG